MEKIQAGQKLWSVVDFRHGRNIDPPKQSEVSVTKVGRKYADLSSGDRIIVETLDIDGGQYGSPGKCYASKEVYDSTEGVVLAWKKLRQDLSDWTPPAGVTIADINAARALLHI